MQSAAADSLSLSLLLSLSLTLTHTHTHTLSLALCSGFLSVCVFHWRVRHLELLIKCYSVHLQIFPQSLKGFMFWCVSLYVCVCVVSLLSSVLLFCLIWQHTEQFISAVLQNSTKSLSSGGEIWTRGWFWCATKQTHTHKHTHAQTHTHTHKCLFLLIVGTFHRLLLLLYWPNNIFYPLITLNLPLTENLFAFLHFQINIIYYF